MFYRDVRRRLALCMLLLIVLASSCLAIDTPRNVILLIGDGMGIGQITAGRLASPEGKLVLDSMPYTGLVKTCPAVGLVTDSAAAGTALATGYKTKNGMISVTPDGQRANTILEVARDHGKATGIISTKFITDATPAVFVSHADSRAKREDIAAQMLESRVDLVMGGGHGYFVPKSAGGKREDDRNLLDEAKAKGYDVFETAEALASSKSERIIGLFASDAMLSERPEPTIAEMTEKAISVLSRNSKGFFLMSEGGKIDSYGHQNNATGMIKEMLMFDEAVGKALEFAKRDGQTLVVVTADHETGGAAARDPDKKNPDKTYPNVSVGWVSGGHSANMVPVYAFGPGAAGFVGTMENTDIPRKIAGLWALAMMDEESKVK